MGSKAIPSDGLVLVTGINGYIASHIADRMLSLGYRVRGTARDNDKLAWMSETFKQRHPSSSFEGVVLKDFTQKEALAEAVAGCAGVIHVATDVSFEADPNKVVPQVRDGLLNILDAANNSQTVKRFVYTSSSIAAVHPVKNERFNVDSNSWNEIDVRDAWAPPPYLPSRAFAVYGASKVEAERAGWEFMKNSKRNFTFNAVLPNFAVGPRLHANQPGSTSGWVTGLFNGDEEKTEWMRTFPPQWSVDVRDVAAIHVAALLESDVQNERLFAFAEPFNYSRIVRILQDIDPSRKHYSAPLEDEGEDLSSVDNAMAVEMLQRMGQESFVPLEDSLREQLQGI